MDLGEFFLGVLTASVAINSGLLVILLTRAPRRARSARLQPAGAGSRGEALMRARAKLANAGDARARAS